MIYGVAAISWGERSKSIPRINWHAGVSDFTGCGAVSVNWVRNPSSRLCFPTLSRLATYLARSSYNTYNTLASDMF